MSRLAADSWRDTTVLVEVTELFVDTAVGGRWRRGILADGSKCDKVFDLDNWVGDNFTVFAAIEVCSIDGIFSGLTSDTVFDDCLNSFDSLIDDISTLDVFRLTVELELFGDRELVGVSNVEKAVGGFSIEILIEEGAVNLNIGLDTDLLRFGTCNPEENNDVGFDEVPDVDFRFAEPVGFLANDCSKEPTIDLGFTETFKFSEFSEAMFGVKVPVDVDDCRFKVAFDVSWEGVHMVVSTVWSALDCSRSSVVVMDCTFDVSTNKFALSIDVSRSAEDFCDSTSKRNIDCSKVEGAVDGFKVEVGAKCLNRADGDNICSGELALDCAVSDRGNNCKFIQRDDGRVWIVNISNGSSSVVCSLRFVVALKGFILFGLNDWINLGIEEVDLTDCNVMLDPKLDMLVDTLDIWNVLVEPQQGFSWYCSLNLTYLIILNIKSSVLIKTRKNPGSFKNLSLLSSLSDNCSWIVSKEARLYLMCIS